jgi:3-phosphoshikimate 1-carboxyvinyltransferase
VGYPLIESKDKNNCFKGKYSANVSSQYICFNVSSAKIRKRNRNNFRGNTSVPYIKMTLALLNDLDIKTSFEGNVIKVYPKQEVLTKEMVVNLIEFASYFLV